MDLSAYAKNHYSQFGEDGIIEKIFETLPPQQRYYCVEFGAWDGQHYSNTHQLIAHKAWNGLLIEGDAKRFAALQQTYASNPKAKVLNTWVGTEGDRALDHLLKAHDIPLDFDLLSIDVDGMDYHIWDAVKTFTPKLVLIEFNQTIPLDIDFIQAKDPKVNHGNSLLSMVKLAKNKGYELICTTHNNAFFVRKQVYAHFGIEDNEISVLRKEHIEAPRIFQLYDGSLMLSKGFDMLWKKRHIAADELQILPKAQRKFAARPSLWKRIKQKITGR